MEYQTKYKSGAQKGLETKLKFWEQRDAKTEFNIAVSQALNLAVEDLGSGGYTNNGLRERTKFFFQLLLEIRNDPEYRKLFESYASVREENNQENKASAATDNSDTAEPY